jgi:antitoxin VapB
MATTPASRCLGDGRAALQNPAYRPTGAPILDEIQPSPYIPCGYTKEAAMRSTVFKTNRTQAVRIPKALAFPDTVKEVEITREGQRLVVTPKRRDWDEYFRTRIPLSDDFPEDIPDLPPEPVEPFE